MGREAPLRSVTPRTACGALRANHQTPRGSPAANRRAYSSESPQEWWKQAAAELDWLPDGCLNIAHGAVDRHALGADAGRTAFRVLRKSGTTTELSYAELAAATNRCADVLARLGLERGDVVCTLAGRVPELYVAALGTLKHGGVYSPLFAAFGPEPIRTRLAIAKARVLVTTRTAYAPSMTFRRADLRVPRPG